MAKYAYIVVQDYQHGVVASRIFARSLEEVVDIFAPPLWTVYRESDDELPTWLDGLKLIESDIDHQEQWLKDTIMEIKRSEF